jgi:uncharacterized protein
MGYLNLIRDFKIYQDGEEIANGEDFKLPTITIPTEDYLLPGMSASVAISQMYAEKMESEMTITGWMSSAYEKMGVPGLSGVGLRVVGAVQNPDTGAISTIEYELRGHHTEVDSGSMKRKEGGSTKVKTALAKARLTENGKEIYHIDARAGILSFGGKDIYAPIREALT